MSEPRDASSAGQATPETGVGGERAARGLPLSAGRALSGYRIDGELGRGAMGVVYAAHDVRGDRPVALKILAPGAPPSRLERFAREAEALARVRHRHIAAVHAAGREAELAFIVMQRVRGEDLAEHLRRLGPLAPRQAAALMAKVARALAAAHAAGVVHRDLKPDNILIDDEGEPVVTDFGLARVGASSLTETGQVLGTPGYMPPELAVGERAGRDDPRVDVYGAGATLFALLTGKPPFTGDSLAAVLTAVVEVRPPDPARVRREVPRALADVVLRCLAKAPAGRYPDAAALADDLERFLAGRPLAGGRRRRWAPAAALLLGLVLLGVAVAVGGPRGRGAPAADASVPPPPPAETPSPAEPDQRSAASPVARPVAAEAARRELSALEGRAERVRGRRAWLERFAGEAGTDEVARALAVDAAAAPLAVYAHADRGFAAGAYLPGGVVTYGGDGRLAQWRPGGGVARVTVSGWPLQAAAPVQDGLLVGGPTNLAWVAVDPAGTAEPDVRLVEHPGVVIAVVATPDGRAIVGGSMQVLVAWSPERPGRLTDIAAAESVTVDLALDGDLLVGTRRVDGGASWVESWRLPEAELVGRWREPRQVVAVAVREALVVAACTDGALLGFVRPDLAPSGEVGRVAGTPVDLAALPRERLLVAVAAPEGAAPDGAVPEGGWLEVRSPSEDEASWRAPLSAMPRGVAVDPAGARVLVATDQGRVEEWALPW